MADKLAQYEAADCLTCAGREQEPEKYMPYALSDHCHCHAEGVDIHHCHEEARCPVMLYENKTATMPCSECGSDVFKDLEPGEIAVIVAKDGRYVGIKYDGWEGLNKSPLHWYRLVRYAIEKAERGTRYLSPELVRELGIA